MDPQPPTSSLPALRSVTIHSLSTITAALINLRALYWPASLIVHTTVRYPKPKTDRRFHDSGYASAEEDADGIGHRNINDEEGDHEARLALLRADELERAFAVRWLTGFIVRSDEWVSASPGCDSGDAGDAYSAQKECENRARVVEEAAALLALSADTQSDGTLSREFSFAVEGEEEDGRIVVELKDESYEQDHESVGLQTWGSACVLAAKICAEPGRYLGFASPASGGEETGLRTIRVLELGAGTGLLSMVVVKLQLVSWICDLGVQFEVMATDYHPAVLENLQENVAHNFGPCVDAVQVEKLDWADPPVVEECDRFDIVLAADVIYDKRHGAWVKNCAEKMLRSGEGRVMWLIVPMRPTRIGEIEGLDHVFGGHDGQPGLRTLEVEDVPRCNNVGRADEVGYRLFRIGWSV